MLTATRCAPFWEEAPAPGPVPVPHPHLHPSAILPSPHSCGVPAHGTWRTDDTLRTTGLWDDTAAHLPWLVARAQIQQKLRLQSGKSYQTNPPTGDLEPGDWRLETGDWRLETGVAARTLPAFTACALTHPFHSLNPPNPYLTEAGACAFSLACIPYIRTPDTTSQQTSRSLPQPWVLEFIADRLLDVFLSRQSMLVRRVPSIPTYNPHWLPKPEIATAE